jgi:hypothetical protein
MGFREDIDTILKEIPEDRQTLLFSATMPKEILDLTRLYQKDPVLIKTVHKELTIPSIEQYYLEVREGSKLELLCRLIDAKNVKLGLVFCNTKKRVDELTGSLQTRGYSAEALHGNAAKIIGLFSRCFCNSCCFCTAGASVAAAAVVGAVLTLLPASSVVLSLLHPANEKIIVKAVSRAKHFFIVFFITNPP